MTRFRLVVMMLLPAAIPACMDPEPDALDPGVSEVGPEIGSEEQAVSCNPSLVYYPVRGPHNNGYEVPWHGSSQWSCDAAWSNSDYIPSGTNKHLGNDIWAAEGTPVIATVSGTFTLVGWGTSPGNKVTIADGCGYYHAFYHLQSIAPGVANGQPARAGQVIGYVGKTGSASGNVVHLHYSIYPAGNYDGGIDPFPYLRAVESNVCNLPAPGRGSSLSGDAKSDLLYVTTTGDLRAIPNLNGIVGQWDSGRRVGTDWSGNNVLFGDLTGDGKEELMFVNSAGNLIAFPNENGVNGVWGSDRSIGNGWRADNAFFADLDGDGRDEVMYVNGSGEIIAFPNVNGITGGWGSERVVGRGWSRDNVFFADLTGDGKDEVMYVNSLGEIIAFPNVNGITGGWGSERAVGRGWRPDNLFLGDLDGNGKYDLLFVTEGGLLEAFPNVDGINGSWGAQRTVGQNWSKFNLFVM